MHVRSGGQVRLYGAKGRWQPGSGLGHDHQSWSTLSTPAAAGSRSLIFNADMALAGWAPGDKVIVASTDYDPRLSEERTIASLTAERVTLTEALTYYHHGSPSTSSVDVERAEVGLLSRSIVIAAADVEHGAHTIATQGFSSVVYSAVEFRNMGLEQFGRYPVHFHNAGSDHGEALIEFNAVHGSRFRCMTVHSTNYVTFAGNVCYNNRGHNVFFEDGPEHSVIVESNFVVGVRQIADRPPLSQINQLRSDRNDFVSAYWFKNADNMTVRNNVAAAAEGVAFMFAFCRQHKGNPTLGRSTGLNTENSQWAEFSGNIAHSYQKVLWNENVGTSRDQSCKDDSGSAQQSPHFDQDGRSYVDFVILQNFGMFKIFGLGIWARSTRLLWSGGFCSDSRNCVETLQGGTMPIREGVITHVTFIGQSANRGNFASVSAPDDIFQRTLPDTEGSRVKPSARWGPVNEGVQDYCFASSCKGLQTSVVLYDGPDMYAHCKFVGYSSPRYCAFAPRSSWDNNQHATATEIFEPIIESGTQLNDLVCVLPGPGFDLNTPDRLLFNIKVTQAGQTSWLVRDHPFYTSDGIGSCTTISTGNNPLAQCTGVRFAMAMVGREWARNQNGEQLKLSRSAAALPVKIGGTYWTSHPEDTSALAYDYEGIVTINGVAWGKSSTIGVPYKLQPKDGSVPNDHKCRSASTCNPSGSSGLCIPSGGGYGYQNPRLDHFDCVCFSGDCCQAGHRCFAVPRAHVSSTRAPSTALTTTAPVTTSTAAGTGVHSGDTIFLTAHTGRIIEVEGTDVLARGQDHGNAQAMTVEKHGGGALLSGDIVFLKTHTGLYLDVQDVQVRSRWVEQGTWQGLTVEKLGGGAILTNDIVCFKTYTGKHLDVQDSVVQARWADCGSWQKMRMQKEDSSAVFSGDSVHLLAHTGHHIEVDGASVGARWNEHGAWQTLQIVSYGGRGIFSGDRIFLTAHTGMMLDVESASTAVRARWNDFGGAWQTLVIEKKGGGAIFAEDTIFLKSSTGTFLDVQGTAVRARWADRGLWQSLTIQTSSARRMEQSVRTLRGSYRMRNSLTGVWGVWLGLVAGAAVSLLLIVLCTGLKQKQSVRANVSVGCMCDLQ